MDDAIEIIEKHIDSMNREIMCLPAKQHRARKALQERMDTFAHVALILRRAKDRRAAKEAQQELPLGETQ
jgi:hypothetical protein